MTEERRALLIEAIAIVTLSVGIIGYNYIKSQNIPCPPAASVYATNIPVPTIAPIASPAAQLWGDAAFNFHISTVLPNGHDFILDDSYPDGSMLVGSEQVCNSSIVSTYTVATGTIRHCHTLVDGGNERTDGRYIAWVTGTGYSGADPVPRQLVGYIDTQTGKVTTLLDQEYASVGADFAVANGYFIWSSHKMHITNMATGNTKALAISGYIVRLDWPNLLYADFSSTNQRFNTVYHLYNLETDQNNTILSTSKRYLPLHLQGTTFYWFDDKHQIQQMDHADLPNPQSHVLFTLPDVPTTNPEVTDRLIIWSENTHVYAWDRVLHQKILLPIPPLPYSTDPAIPLILGKVILLYNQGGYTIVDTAKLPTTVTP